MSKYWNLTLKSFFVLVFLFSTVLVHAKTVKSDVLSQQTEIQIQAQVVELLAMDCGSDENLKKLTVTLEKASIDVSPTLIKILQEGIPEKTLDAVRSKAIAKYKARQSWLMSQNTALLDKQTVERLLNENFDEYLANLVRRLKIRYEENALLGLKQIGKKNAIDSINRAVKREPELAKLGEKTVKAIEKREYIKQLPLFQ